jgi:hypothetical protein
MFSWLVAQAPANGFEWAGVLSTASPALMLAIFILAMAAGNMGDEDTAADLHEARARVLALEARVAAIEERSKE